MAKINLGYMHQNGLAGYEKNPEVAFKLYIEGVDVCQTQSSFYLSLCIVFLPLFCYNVLKFICAIYTYTNYQYNVLLWESQDPRNTVGDGHALLANMYATGTGCEIDERQARTHIRLAKEKRARVPLGLEELVFGKGCVFLHFGEVSGVKEKSLKMIE